MVPNPSRARLDALRARRSSENTTTTVDPAKLDAYLRAFDSLAPSERDAYVARFEQGHTYEHIAADIGAESPDGAREAVSRAVARLVEDVSANECSPPASDGPPLDKRVKPIPS